MPRYVALLALPGSWMDRELTPRAIDAPDKEKASQAAWSKMLEGESGWCWIGDLHILTSNEAENLKNALERCESKRVPDAKWRK